ncbi:hypothetical protein VD0002_g7274 [Verticillium dahliae]|uniref:Prenylcysteine oxidase n=2 Tax=Verticillium dahliae TaxID=27337 RepID=G2X158_VERDV|nr:prenylcysteine oxidase [Verticillium dahliae VdLs.17]EGY22549.1 prenylcysteine oxidase [Verticillium dahliae VdLs.17]KAH6704973.1 prenylcysteine oxidase [Verticillium dahliae]PNH31845.1 hypothetical protein BJF96_g4979 [Verticillium dahliae]PNH60362.1 hypothetical protein VD0002_g7274 [Verticillium dahliae]
MFWKLSTVLSAFSLTAPAADVVEDGGVKQVAIIGAGASGSAAAYYLSKFAEEDGSLVNITVFERTDRIGGRTLTVNAYDSPSEPIELGASIFVDANYILINATRDFNLALKDPESGSGETLGIWDGEKFVFTQDDRSWGWWNLAKLFWKYGTAPYKAQNLVKSTVAAFLQIYEAPHFPFQSLTQVAQDLGLLKITGITGTQFLAKNDISEQFAREIMQAATRVNYASNLPYIHGLETMVSMAPEGASQVVGGNWQIFSSMLEHSNATVYQQTSVASITLKNQTDQAAPAKYLISTKATGSSAETAKQHQTAFDNVVIATPWQFADIDAERDVLKTIDSIPYTRLHVTLFCSPFLLSPTYFGLPADSKAPGTVLTTLGSEELPKPGSAGAGKAGFYSVSTLRTIVNPKTLKEEFAYKIFSPAELTPEFLSALLGVKVPDTFISEQKEAVEGETVTVDPISWYYPHAFHSYPMEYPRITFQEPALGNGLYYTSGIESFISTMETSALMGKNVARLIADELVADAEKNALEAPAVENQAEDTVQEVLGVADEVVQQEL